nr:hypothetical protein [Tanacetum cinerariifolium]
MSTGRVTNEEKVQKKNDVKERKDSSKAIMHESEPSKKIKKMVQVQMNVDEKLAKKLFEEEQAIFNVERKARSKAEQEQEQEQEQERIDFEAALKLKEQLDEREEFIAKDDQAHDIDWSNPAMIRYHALQNRTRYVVEVRKNMCIYLKNQGGNKWMQRLKRSKVVIQRYSLVVVKNKNLKRSAQKRKDKGKAIMHESQPSKKIKKREGYKMKHFKGMRYDEIRPIFEKVWDEINYFMSMDSELELQRLKRAGQDVEEKPAKR